ncbi:hypothetical protein HYH03_014029 [Edaphochlamys debaryana]|uniref:Uncharacterized protein n=1 Tax=Edaphochlamys debaryana TaxID=47281 RepID=A0A835XPR9_9CHLO|nr:hypothetical protein HYH03_014029 [Edaphochlamys debaryana]|eukprot:KAG2487312.1 hypothetical protein HYH03_014029 [Edaphochlamys debaryana]
MQPSSLRRAAIHRAASGVLDVQPSAAAALDERAGSLDLMTDRAGELVCLGRQLSGWLQETRARKAALARLELAVARDVALVRRALLDELRSQRQRQQRELAELQGPRQRDLEHEREWEAPVRGQSNVQLAGSVRGIQERSEPAPLGAPAPAAPAEALPPAQRVKREEAVQALGPLQAQAGPTAGPTEAQPLHSELSYDRKPTDPRCGPTLEEARGSGTYSASWTAPCTGGPQPHAPASPLPPCSLPPPSGHPHKDAALRSLFAAAAVQEDEPKGPQQSPPPCASEAAPASPKAEPAAALPLLGSCMPYNGVTPATVQVAISAGTAGPGAADGGPPCPELPPSLAAAPERGLWSQAGPSPAARSAAAEPHHAVRPGPVAAAESAEDGRPSPRSSSGPVAPRLVRDLLLALSLQPRGGLDGALAAQDARAGDTAAAGCAQGHTGTGEDLAPQALTAMARACPRELVGRGSRSPQERSSLQGGGSYGRGGLQGLHQKAPAALAAGDEGRGGAASSSRDLVSTAAAFAIPRAAAPPPPSPASRCSEALLARQLNGLRPLPPPPPPPLPSAAAHPPPAPRGPHAGSSTATAAWRPQPPGVEPEADAELVRAAAVLEGMAALPAAPDSASRANAARRLERAASDERAAKRHCA